MEDQAPYHAEAPSGPRNLAAPIAAWLRTQDFTVTEQTQPHFAAVGGHWLGPRGERFQLTYFWQSGPLPDATCWLEVHEPGQARAEVLFTPQHVRKVKDLRLLVGNCVRLANARLLAKLAPLPASSNPSFPMADTPSITPERQALLQALAQQAAAWWREQVAGPGYLSKFDNGDRSQAGELGQLLASMAALKSPPPSAQKFARFEQLLTQAVLERLLRKPVPEPRDLSHLDGNHHDFTRAELDDMRARAAASAACDVVLGTDYGPEGLLRQVAEEAQVSGFPWKTTMWVCWDADPAKCYVEVRAGYGRATQRLPLPISAPLTA